MFRKKNKLIPLIQDLPLPPDTEWRTPLKIVLEDIEKELKDSLCAISYSLPIVPLRAAESKADGRLFTPDVFDTIPLLKHLSHRRRNPINREPLFINDLGKHLLVVHELINKIDELLAKNNYTRDELLKEFGISKELYQFLLNSEYSTKEVSYSRHMHDAIDEFEERESYFMLGFAYFLLTLSALMFLAIIWIKREDIFTTKWLDVLYQSIIEGLGKVIEILPDIFEAISQLPMVLMNRTFDFANFVLKSSIDILSDIDSHVFQVAKYSSQLFLNAATTLSVPALTVTSTALVSRETFLLQEDSKKWHDNSSKQKLMLFTMSLVILLLGLDAVTDCCGLVTSMTPNFMKREVLGLLPLLAVGVSGFFGQDRQRSKAKRDFDELVENDYEYKMANK